MYLILCGLHEVLLAKCVNGASACMQHKPTCNIRSGGARSLFAGYCNKLASVLSLVWCLYDIKCRRFCAADYDMRS